MKKYMIILFLVLCMTGCGTKNLTCTSENDEDGSTMVVEAELSSRKLKYAKATITFATEAETTNMCKIFGMASDAEGNVECDEYHIYIDNYHKSLNSKGLSKKEFLNYMEKQGYTCKSK